MTEGAMKNRKHNGNRNGGEKYKENYCFKVQIKYELLKQKNLGPKCNSGQLQYNTILKL